VVALALNLLRVIAIVSAPWIPETSGRILDALGVAYGGGWVEGAELDALPAGHPVRAIEPLFEKVTDEEVAAWRARFAGGAPSL
jgi:methionyl-tRNA synthetase